MNTIASVSLKLTIILILIFLVMFIGPDAVSDPEILRADPIQTNAPLKTAFSIIFTFFALFYTIRYFIDKFLKNPSGATIWVQNNLLHLSAGIVLWGISLTINSFVSPALGSIALGISAFTTILFLTLSIFNKSYNSSSNNEDEDDRNLIPIPHTDIHPRESLPNQVNPHDQVQQPNPSRDHIF